MNQPFKLSIDLGKDGRQDGYLNVKTTSELSPFGCSMVPVTSIRNGDGPCVVVIGGCHGDEYEGQIIARSLLGAVEVEHVRGQLIVLPAANAKAVRAGRRFSPSDDGNLNAVFPGREAARRPSASRISSRRSCCRAQNLSWTSIFVATGDWSSAVSSTLGRRRSNPFGGQRPGREFPLVIFFSSAALACWQPIYPRSQEMG
ncbi:succinylglutamate desuccinylase/aspartoacylase family protein [Bradyrhizobium sp. RDM4]|uniref:succinylglutamate desuccinylase/aspartoacylase domain-containing protein n=1 Tax=Bradyrhizobium sp. RDM4 TaxID=3378765 RepID=UPI0038FC8F50